MCTVCKRDPELSQNYILLPFSLLLCEYESLLPWLLFMLCKCLQMLKENLKLSVTWIRDYFFKVVKCAAHALQSSASRLSNAAFPYKVCIISAESWPDLFPELLFHTCSTREQSVCVKHVLTGWNSLFGCGELYCSMYCCTAGFAWSSKQKDCLARIKTWLEKKKEKRNIYGM